jgi:hypothetical protein
MTGARNVRAGLLVHAISLQGSVGVVQASSSHQRNRKELHPDTGHASVVGKPSKIEQVWSIKMTCGGLVMKSFR